MVERVTNNKIQPKRTKAIDMQFHRLHNSESQDQFKIYWQPRKMNLADYYTKHHPPNHHTNVREKLLTKVQYVAEARWQRMVNGQFTIPQTQMASYKGVIVFLRKVPMYRSLGMLA
jgi:hypothetical protein